MFNKLCLIDALIIPFSNFLSFAWQSFRDTIREMPLSPETLGCSYEGTWARIWSGLRVLPLHPAGWVVPNLCIPQTCGFLLLRSPVNLMLSLYLCACFFLLLSISSSFTLFVRTKSYSEHRHCIVLITMRLGYQHYESTQSSHTFSVTV